ncbi:MAG: cupin domain-containing protein [Alphaproteobacteria bacterium]|nr:MAG: cupin domain-containing protein [Alphaproteobacteria bacterium]
MSDTTETYPWGDMIWHKASPAPFTAASMFIHSGAHCGKHCHDNADEMVIVSAGSIELHFEDGDTVTLHTGESYLVAKDTPHEIVNHPHAPARVTLVFDNVDRTYIPFEETPMH